MTEVSGPSLRVLAPLQEPGPYPRTLPPLLEPPVGRDREIAECLDLLAGGCRLLTITGPGGVGKTRLATEVAGRASDVFERAVVFAELTALTDPALVLPAVASAAGFDAGPGESGFDVLIGGFGSRRTLLVLDNLEQIRVVGPGLSDLLRACPRLQIVATSRVALAVPAETARALEPLDLHAATELLVRQVQRFDPAFAVDVHTAQRVAEVCRRLDGLPLAIELAAARLRLLSLDELVRLLGRRLDVLRSTRRDLPPHQRTLRTTIEWSYRLLDPGGQAALRYLSVFAGGATVDAMAAVLGVDTFEVLDRLDGLVAHHLVRVVPDSGAPTRRFDLFESVREFAAGALDSEGEAPLAFEAHAAWVHATVTSATDLLTGPDQAAALELLDAELGNIRAALQRRSASRSTDDAVALIAPLWRYWWMRGHLDEGRRWTMRLIEAYEGEPTTWLGRALLAAADLAEEQSDSAAAEQLLGRARDVFEHLGDELGVADCANSLGMVARSSGDLDRAESLQSSAAAVFAAMAEDRRSVTALNSLATIAYLRGDFATAESRLREAVEAMRRLGDRRSLGQLLCNLASAIQAQGDAVMALEHFEEARRIADDLGDAVGGAHVVANLGSALVSAGELDRAGSVLADGLDRALELSQRDIEASVLHSLGRLARAAGHLREAGDRWLDALDVFGADPSLFGFADCLEGIAGLAVEARRHADAGPLLAWAAERRGRDGSAPESGAEGVAGDIASVRDAVGDSAFAEFETTARAWTPTEIRARAAAVVERLPVEREQRSRPETVRLAAKRLGITPRELDVIDRLARRLTDQEIAAELYVSIRTVTTHVSAVLRKLAVPSRRDVAEAARDAGILPPASA